MTTWYKRKLWGLILKPNILLRAAEKKTVAAENCFLVWKILILGVLLCAWVLIICWVTAEILVLRLELICWRANAQSWTMAQRPKLCSNFRLTWKEWWSEHIWELISIDEWFWHSCLLILFPDLVHRTLLCSSGGRDRWRSWSHPGKWLHSDTG